MLKKTLLPFLFGVMIILSGAAVAENSQDFGDYVVHFNALNTNYLSPAITREYGLKRSKNRGMVNIAILRKVMGTTGKPVAAEISGTATNLAGQKRNMNLREIRDGNAIYYIADFPIAHEETLRFVIHVKPEDKGDAHEVKFTHQFFTE